MVAHALTKTVPIIKFRVILIIKLSHGVISHLHKLIHPVQYIPLMMVQGMMS